MNDQEIKIGVYYIATGPYKVLFPEFLESLQNFYPPYKKVVKVISDGLEEYAIYEKGNVKVELCPRINHYPWPVVTLYKMWNILENRDDTCDFCCYFNGNAQVFPHDMDVFSSDKLTTSYHSFNTKTIPYDPWPHISLDPNSVAYLENGTYEYVQAAFFFGPRDLFYQMCEEVNAMVKDDTGRYLFAQWHDESYLNKWCVMHPEFVEKKYVLAAYSDDVDETRFVHLRDKRNYDINK
ncbi:MAG: hypothetical protein J6X28_05030 [Bacilli bacterium]|nr:hypothetical protein [Bacilli bacterium]